MRKPTLLLIALLLGALFTAPALGEAAGEEPAEWTVMFYLCGSDLESKHGFASEGLRDIAKCGSYEFKQDMFSASILDSTGDTADRVNVVVQTGGAQCWQCEDLDMAVDTGALQRWRFEPVGMESFSSRGTYELEQTLPLQSMAEPQTLSDFIRWSAENHPAKRYALVLWDHGGGAKDGLFIDELFDGDMMRLDELKAALAAGGVRFDTLLLDACLMANLETACAVKDSADWMVASEELVAGKGTDVGSWLQMLYYAPGCDGRCLGRWICETTQRLYSREVDAQTRETVTWSLIDLSKIDRLAGLFDQMFQAVGDAYANSFGQMSITTQVFREAFEFGLGTDDMIDLTNLFYDPLLLGVLDNDLYGDFMRALVDAVAFNVRGTDRAEAGGLSFCYATSFTPAELEAYAYSCPSAHYLALLDAINPDWTAPDWAYERAERLPEITGLGEYRIRVEKHISEDGVPGLIVTDGKSNMRLMHADLYRLDRTTGEALRMGSQVVIPSFTEDLNEAFDFNFVRWPAVEGVPCSCELVWISRGVMWFNIPVQIGSQNYLLRCTGEIGKDNLEMLGLWEGFDADSQAFSRNVKPTSQIAGQEFRLLYPVEGAGFAASEPMTMPRRLDVASVNLEPGDYRLDYWAEDMFMRHLPVDSVEIHWDGETLTVPEGAWQGTQSLVTPTK